MPIRSPRNGLRGERRKHRGTLYVPIKALRLVTDTTLEELAEAISEAIGVKPSVGTLSAIESGDRGASVQLIDGIEKAYDLPSGMVSGAYRPRVTARADES